MSGFLYSSPSGVTVSDWVDLTATITSAVSGGLDADPDSQAGGLTVTTTTGTFNADSSYPCNSFSYTGHASLNTGTGRAMRVSLGTVASLISGYDGTGAVQLVCDCVDAGAGWETVDPVVGVFLAPSGTLPSPTPTTYISGAGIELESSTAARLVLRMHYSGLTTHSASGADVTSEPWQMVADVLPSFGVDVDSEDALVLAQLTGFDAEGDPFHGTASRGLAPAARSASDELVLVIGHDGSGAVAVGAFKLRFRVRWISSDATEHLAAGHSGVV